MRPVTFLHIGMNKAGSTSIQAAFAGYQDDRLEYLTHEDAPTATYPLVMGYRDRPPGSLIGQSQTSEGNRAAARLAFEALLARSDRSALLSSEHLSNFPSLQNTTDVIDAVLNHSVTVRVISYLRPPRAFLRSSLQQLVKHSPAPDRLDALWPAYGPRNERWRKAVEGRGKMAFVAFRPDQFRGSDLLADFCYRIGADRACLNDVTPQNEGLSLEATAVLAAWHKTRVIANPATPRRYWREDIVTALQGFGQTRDWGLSDAAVAGLSHQRQKDLAWATRRTGCADFAEEPAPEVTVDSVDQVLSLAGDLVDPLEDWAATVAPDAKPSSRTVYGILSAVDAALYPAAGPSASLGRRVARAALRRLRPTR